MKASSLVSRLWPSASPSVFGFSLVSRLRFLILSLLRMCASKKERTDTTLKFDRHLQAGQDLFSVFDKNCNVASSLVVIHWRIVYVTTSHSTHYTCMQCHRSLVPLTQQEMHRRYTRLRTYVRTKTTYVLLSLDAYVCTYILLFQPATSS